MIRILKMTVLLLSLVSLTGCRQDKGGGGEKQESREAKRLLQGVWMYEETETLAFQMKGDTVFYADSTSMPAYFKVVDDTLYVGEETRYHIEKQTAHVLWFTNQRGEVDKFVKIDNTDQQPHLADNKYQALQPKEVLKRDTVVFHQGERYHCYVAINPTKYKVVRHALNDDGLDVENVYYDNIIHLSIYQGGSALFSSDFRKQNYAKSVPAAFLEQSILSDMLFEKTDAQGFHFRVTLCVPDDASCYIIHQTVSFKGAVTFQALDQ